MSDEIESFGFEDRPSHFETVDVSTVLVMLYYISTLFIIYTLTHKFGDFL